MPTSTRIEPLYPPKGASAIADAIRERRGARGLTPLDGTLLHTPAIAEGWNKLLGAVRTQGKLSGDLRELMILRIAALNNAAFEWIQHEPVARSAGLATCQLRTIRDTSCIGTSNLTHLQAAALVFTEHSTRSIRVPSSVIETLNFDEALLVEAAAVVSTYNMVSRFLVSLDVAGMAEERVPWPADTTEHDIPVKLGTVHVRTLAINSAAPWVMLSNSLLTDMRMWDPLLPFLLEKYNVILYNKSQANSIDGLANDIADVLTFLSTQKTPIQLPIHALIGVSLGGATTLACATNHPTFTRSIIACDTAPRTPPGNREAWEARIHIGTTVSMEALAELTLPRWFPPTTTTLPLPRAELIHAQIEETSLDDLKNGATALMDYSIGVALQCKALFVAGSADGGGKVAEGMRALAEKLSEGEGNVQFVQIEGAGHLPMVDKTEEFWGAVKGFLENV